MKKVSIMMPAYNAMPLLKASIESILNQSYTNWECIIVNDGSTDGTGEYLDSLTDSRFIVHHFKQNQGRPKARQQALNMTTGDYITMLDAEDLMDPDRLELQVKVLEENPEISLVSSSMCSFGTKTELTRVRGSEKFRILAFDGDYCPIHAASMLYGEQARKLEYNPMMKFGQDRDFLERYLKGKMFAEMPDVLYYYSEFDSVNKRKIKRTYKLNAKKFIKEHKVKASVIASLKYLYSVTVFPFVSIESILLKRGRALTKEQETVYNKDCKSIVDKILKSSNK